MDLNESPNPFDFEPPGEVQAQAWDFALAEGLKFPNRYMQKCKDFSRMREQNEQLQSKMSFVMRNLISIVDNCEEALAPELATPAPAPSTEVPHDTGPLTPSVTTVPLTIVPGEVERTEAASRETGPMDAASVPPISGEAASLAGVYRCILNVMEHLGMARVELLGQTYENVTFEGHRIDDPFQVIDVKQEGPVRKLPVQEIVSSLWVQRVDGGVRILRQGKVYC